MPCKECGCTKAVQQALVEDTSNLTLAERKAPDCNCSAKSGLKSCCSSASNSTSRPNGGCSCCCRSCCACCRCCSRSSGDFRQDGIKEASTGGCTSCKTKKEEVVKQASCGCNR